MDKSVKIKLDNWQKARVERERYSESIFTDSLGDSIGLTDATMEKLNRLDLAEKEARKELAEAITVVQQTNLIKRRKQSKK